MLGMAWNVYLKKERAAAAAFWARLVAEWKKFLSEDFKESQWDALDFRAGEKRKKFPK